MKYIRNEKIVTANISNELGMLNIESGKYYVADSIAVDIWKMLFEAKNINQLVDELINEYDVTFDKCKNDVEKFIQHLVDKKLVLEV